MHAAFTWLRSVVIALVLTAAAAPLLAQQPGDDLSDWDPATDPPLQNVEHIQRFDVAATVQRDGTVEIVETIRVYFPEPRRGLIRELVQTGRGRFGQHARTPIDVQSVVDDVGRPHPFTIQQGPAGPALRIGDPDVTFTGERTYVITYTITRVILFHEDADEDELYWNVTGNEWRMSINRATCRVTLPSDVRVRADRVIAFVGPFGSTERLQADAIRTAGANAVEITCDRRLDIDEGLTVAVRWPRGHVNQPNALDRIGWVISDNAGLIWLLGIAAASLVIALLIRLFANRDASYFEPNALAAPATNTLRDELSPIEAGVLIDCRLDAIDLAAQTVDLATRGYLVIYEDGGDAELEPGPRYDDRDGLPPEDVAILDAITSSDGATLPAVLRPNPAKVTPRVGPMIKKRLRKNGMIKPVAATGRVWIAFLMIAVLLVSVFLFIMNMPASAPDMWFPIGFLCMFLGVGCGVGIPKDGPGLTVTLIWSAGVCFMFGALAGDAIGNGEIDFVAATGILTATMLTAIAAKVTVSSGRYAYLTAKGARLLGRVRSYENYLRDRQRFQGTPTEAGAEFERHLAYAIALGLADAWAARFKDIEVEEKPRWLRTRTKVRRWSDVARRSNHCADHLRRQFIYIPRTSSGGSSSSRSSGFSSSSYSGGFSSGGSSGGGFGGGGGGSW